MLVKKGKTYLYIEPKGFEQLKKLVYGVPNLEVYCPSDDQYDDRDSSELLKINYFYRIIQNTKKVKYFIFL